MAERTAFANWLDREMKARRLTQAKLAAYMERGQPTVSAWLAEGRIPRPAACADLAKALHMPVEDVLRAAGHLPPIEDGAEEPGLPAWLTSLLLELDEAELRVVEASARAVRQLREERTPYEAAPPAPDTAPE